MFNQTQVNQYLDIYRRWYYFDDYAVPARYHREVIRHAKTWGFVVAAENNKTVYINKATSYLTGLDLPDEVLFAIVKPALQVHSGFSITKHSVWQYLNFHQDDVQSMEKVLFRLHDAGFITFASAGTVWRIEENN